MQRQYHLSMMADVTSATQPIDVVRVRGGVRSAANDQAAAEEPLEVRLHGRPFATIMRTPGADRELAAGFLLAERIITSADDLAAIEYCRDNPNVVEVSVIDDRALARAGDARRAVTSACGVCG